MENRVLYVITGQILIALTILASTLFVTSAIKQIKFGQGTIYVKGCAERLIESDYATWSGYISASAAERLIAYDTIERDQNILLKYFLEQGISSTDVVFSPVQTCVVYQRNNKGIETTTVERYDMFQNFSIATTNIPLIARVSQKVTNLIKEGLAISANAPQYFYLNIDALKIQMLSDAAKDARQRAEELVTKSSGSSVGSLRSAHQGVFQITPAHSTSVSDYGEFDTNSIAKKIKAVVTLEYTID
jgi:uncharacterized protein